MSQLLERLTIGSWITLAHPSIAEIMASAGFDWLAIDLEHSVITIREAEELIRVINLKGITPLVRLSSNNHEQIKRVMDAGSHGVIVPMVKTLDDAASAVRAVKYPPIGERSFGLARAQKFGVGFKDYINWQESNSLVVVQIEHIEAVDNLESILSVPGIDAYFVGPYDLSGSLGIPGQFEHPLFIDAMAQIRHVSTTIGTPGGLHVVEPSTDQLRKSVEDGYVFIAYSLDIRMLDVACRHGLASVSELNP